MKTRFVFLLRLFIYWLLTFFIAKSLFLLVNSSQTASLSVPTIGLSLFYSLRLDVATTAYLMLFPLLLLFFFEWLPRLPKWLTRLLLAYTLLAQLAVALVVIFDAFTYRHWGYHLDINPVVLYIKTPAESMASMLWWEILLPILFLLFWLLAAAWACRFWLRPLQNNSPQRKYSLLWLLAGALLIIPMRGGLQQIPINAGAGYFSDNIFANHATVNAFWNFGYSYTRWQNMGNEYRFFAPQQAQQYFERLQQQNDSSITTQYIKRDSNQTPNVLLIIVESLTASVVPRLGGEAVAVRFDSLTHQGILFSQFYANGDRSEEGVIAILSGFPPLPTISAAAYPDRVHKLPSLLKDFKQHGYQTAFYAGSEGSFANIGAYLRSQSVEKLVEKKDFPSAHITTQWGVHDHLVFDYVFNDITRQQTNQPFFAIVETLSSHEPFDVPPPQRFTGNSRPDLFRNAIAYTDNALADFINQLSQHPIWENLWVLVVADHGHRLPLLHAPNDAKSFHIPMLWLGGAVLKKDSIIADIAAQTDIPALVGQQLGWDSPQQYPFSKIAAHLQNPHAFYTYNNGFGLLTQRGACIYDHNAKQNAWLAPDFPAADTLGRAYLQLLEQHFKTLVEY